LCLEQATIAEWQGASEDQKFVAKPTRLNMNLFFANGIIPFIRNNVYKRTVYFAEHQSLELAVNYR
jgi:hypothetical protein